MAIVEAEVIPYWLPFRRDYVTARGRLARREMVLLRLRDHEGLEGWGEAVPLSLRGGASLERVVAELTGWATHATEASAREKAPDRGLISVSSANGLSAPARCAVRTALGDLEAKRRDVPLWRLLGADRCVPVPCNATLISGTAEAVAADAERWAADGFTTFKLKVGLLADLPPDERPSGAARGGAATDPDLAQIEAVRSAVGPQARIRLDANGAWSVDRAEYVLRSAADLGIELVEQPVADIERMAELRRRLPPVRESTPADRARVGQIERQESGSTGSIAIAADESVTSPEEAIAARDAVACDLATVKLSKVGALRPDLGGALPFYLSSALDGPVGIAAAAHAFQALSPSERACLPPAPTDPGAPGEPLAQGLATQRLFGATVASRGCELRGAELHVPEGTGLGVEIDGEALDAHRL